MFASSITRVAATSDVIAIAPLVPAPGTNSLPTMLAIAVAVRTMPKYVPLDMSDIS
jgi:hypothetical protein